MSSPDIYCPDLVLSFVMVEAGQWSCLCLGWGRRSFPVWKEWELELLVSVAGHKAWAWHRGLARGLVWA